jgi:hypothetical protein
MKLNPVIYNVKGIPEKKKIGFIAENAADLLLDELVVYNGDNEIEYFNYDQMTSFITKIVQDQQKQIEDQQKQLEYQQKQLEDQQKQLEDQQKQLEDQQTQINDLKELILSRLQ